MPGTAYDLQRFEPRRQEKNQPPRLKVAKAPRQKRLRQFAGMLRTVAMCAIVVVLVFAVLRTNAVMTELHSDIATAERQLREEEARSTYLTGELGQMVNLRTVEERAAELGLVKMEAGSITYIRVEEAGGIEVKTNGFQSFLQNILAGFAGIFSSGE